MGDAQTDLEREILTTVGDEVITWGELKSVVDTPEKKLKKEVYALLKTDELDADRHVDKEWDLYKPVEEIKTCGNCGVEIVDDEVVKKPVAGQHWGLKECGECGESVGTYII